MCAFLVIVTGFHYTVDHYPGLRFQWKLVAGVAVVGGFWCTNEKSIGNITVSEGVGICLPYCHYICCIFLV